MRNISPLFPPGTYCIKTGKKVSVYKGRRILLARLTPASFKYAIQFSLLRDVTTEKEKPFKRYVLDRKSVRALHGKNSIKKAYKKYLAGQPADQVKTKSAKNTAPARPEPSGDLFSPRPSILPEKTVLSVKAAEAVLNDQSLRDDLSAFFECTDRTIRNWIAGPDPMLTTPDAVSIIQQVTGLTPAEILTKTPL